MKKFKSILFTSLSIMMICLFMLTGCSCGQTTDILAVTPDGAPALSFAQMLYEDNDKDNIKYTVVNSENIQSYVATEKADIAVLPLNAATKLCKDVYKIVAVTTHGNLYVLGKTEITDLNTLLGKKVGVIQYPNVPGLTFRAILEGNNIPYTLLGSVGDEADANKVNLVSCEPTEVGGLLKSNKVDYCLSAEPASTKVVTTLSADGVKVCLDLQEAYKTTFNGETFPQAVTIVKKSLIENNPKLVKKFIEKLQQNDEFLTENNIEKILEGINSHLEDGYAGSLSKGNLNITSMANCNVKYVDAYSVKQEIYNYISKIRNVDNTKINEITDSIFYNK